MLVAMLTLLLLLPALRPDPGNNPPDETRQEALPSEGLWPTEKMLQGLLARWADDTAFKYDLDDEQARRTREMMTKRWSAFLKENRQTLQPLLNEYLEARFAPEPPDPETVKRWAQRALPLFDDFQKEVHATQEELSDLLTPPQKAKLSLESIKTNTRLHLFGTRLQAWQRGEFEQVDWWQLTQRQHRQQHAMEDKTDNRRNLVGSKAKTRIDEELLRWDRFVTDFVNRFKLDDTQTEAAYSILRECKGKALAHRDRYRARLERLEKAATASGTLSDKLRAEGIAMYGPIDDIFVELKSRLEQIPTTAQTAGAAPKVNPSTKSKPKTDAKVN